MLTKEQIEYIRGTLLSCPLDIDTLCNMALAYLDAQESARVGTDAAAHADMVQANLRAALHHLQSDGAVDRQQLAVVLNGALEILASMRPSDTEGKA